MKSGYEKKRPEIETLAGTLSRIFETDTRTLMAMDAHSIYFTSMYQLIIYNRLEFQYFDWLKMVLRVQAECLNSSKE